MKKILSFLFAAAALFVVTNSIASASGNMPQILTSSLPNGHTTGPYQATVRARDVDLGDSLTMLSQGLPEGMYLDNCYQTVISNSERLFCDIAGTAEEAGTYTFKLGVMDQDGNIGTRHYTIEITDL